MNGQRGQAITEFVITMTVLLFLLLGVFQISLLIQAKFLNNFAAWAACRAGIVNRGNGDDEMTNAAATALSPLFGDVSGIPFGSFFGTRNESINRTDNQINPSPDGFHRTRVNVLSPTPADFPGASYRFEDRNRIRQNLLTVQVEHDYELFVPFAGNVLGAALSGAANAGGYFLSANEPGGASKPYIKNQGGRYFFVLKSDHTMRMQTDPTESDFDY